MERKTVFFNSDQGPNTRRVTSNGGVEIVKYGNGTSDLFIRGAKGGLRHVVIIPDHEALLLGQTLVALYSEAPQPDLLRAVQLVLAIHDNPEQQSHPIKLDPMAEKQLREAVAKAN